MTFGVQALVSVLAGMATAAVITVGGTAAVKSSQASPPSPENASSVGYADE